MDGDIWQEYALLQQRADRPKIDALTWAHEEQANEFLTSHSNGNRSAEPAHRRKAIKNIGINRRRKHVHRQFLLQRHAASLYPTAQSIEALVIARLTIEFLRTLATCDEWRILQCIANGEDYKTIALAEHRTVAALKSLVSRCRTRLKTRR